MVSERYYTPSVREQVEMLAKTIDEELDNPAHRMIVKLYLDNFDVDEIARFGGVPRDYVQQVIAAGKVLLEKRVGCFFSAMETLCLQQKTSMLYG